MGNSELVLGDSSLQLSHPIACGLAISNKLFGTLYFVIFGHKTPF